MSLRGARCLGISCLLWLIACDGRQTSSLAEAGAAGDGAATPPLHGGAPSEGGNATGSAGEAASSGTESAGGAGAAGVAGAPNVACDVDAVQDLLVFSPTWDALGYPPYAIDGCTLVYVAAEDGGGALRRRDLATGEDILLEAAPNQARRPTVSGGVIAWERYGAGGSEVSVLTTTPARTRHFGQAGEPRAASNGVVFTKFLGAAPTDDTDVMLYDVDEDTVTTIATGAAQQRFADVSSTHVAFTDFSEDPRGYFHENGSISDIVIVERGSGKQTVRAAPGKQAFPLLGQDGVLAYLEWGDVHPEPKFEQFRLRAGKVDEPVSADFNVKPGDGWVTTEPAYVRPSLHGRYLDFVDRLALDAQLFRVTLGTDAAPTPVPIANASNLFGPVAAASLTLVAKPSRDQKLSLIAISR